MKWLPLLLCMRLLCLGQTFSLRDLPFLQAHNTAAGADAALPSGIAHRWKASDLATSPVTDWVDEIQGFHLTASQTPAPLLGPAGVLFYGTNGLSGTNWTLSIGSTAGAALDTFLCVFQITGNVLNFNPVAVNFESGGQIVLEEDGNVFYDPNSPEITPVLNTVYDWLYAGHVGSIYPVYTNGVSGPTRSSGWGIQAISTIGYAHSVGPDYFLTGNIKEFIHWTNVVGFTSVQVSNVHYYCTNTYGYAP